MPAPSALVAHARTLVGLAAALVLLPSAAADFVYDDQLLVLGNPRTASLSSVPEFFVTHLWAGVPETDALYYRPLLLVDLALDRALFGLSPAAHHLHGLAWHLLAAALFGRLLARIGLGPVPAALGMAVFALHPAQVEAVMLVAARNDPMAAAWLFGALLLLASDRPRVIPGAAAVLGAALCKESAVVAPLLLALVEWARTGRPGRPAAFGAVGLGLAAAAVMRAVAGVPWPAGASADRMLDAFGVAGPWYARVLVWPVALPFGATVTWPPPAPWWAVGLLAALGLAAASSGRKAVAGLGIAAVAALPALPAVAHVGIVPDRYLNLSLAGVALAAGAFVDRHPRAALPAATLAAGLLVATSAQLPSWRTDRDLWSMGVARAPSPFTWGGLAKVLEIEGDLDGAARFYGLAVAPPRPFPHACYNAAAIHLRRGDPAMAATEGHRALDAGCPPAPELLAPMAVGLAATGSWEEARAVAERVGRDPTGKAVVVRIAAAVRGGDSAALEGAPPELEAQVRWLLSVAP